MADPTPDQDDPFEASHPADDSGDYNPESIDYEAQENDSAEEQEEEVADDPTNEPPNEQIYEEEEYMENTYQPEHQSRPQDQYPDYPQEFASHRSPVASRSPEHVRSPTAPRQYDPTMSVPPHTAANDHDTTDTFKSPTDESRNDIHPIPQQPPTDLPQDQSALPKSVDLQALLAGLVPARSKISSPPQPRDRPVPQAPSQTYPTPSGLPPPAMNLPPDIMYQLQNLASPPPQSAPQFQQPSPQHQAPPQQQSGPIDIQPEDLALTLQEERLYEKFLQNEREVVQSAQWDQFPHGSRMFIGNLPSDRIGKKDVFRLFYPYGRLAQISIKQAYGFVQFYEKADCDTAIQAQQGMVITGRRVHLEISKPQKQKEGDGSRGRGKRDRSPFSRDRDRSPPPGRGRGRARGRGYDDYEPRGRPGSREFSPRGAGGGGGGGGYGRRDDDFGGRRYSRSRSPVARGYRSPSPPRRALEPPEVALLVKDDPERAYIHHVEDMFEDRRIRTDTIFVSPRVSIQDITKQMVLDGVLAVVFLSRPLQDRRKISMQTFQRNPADPASIKWDEYNEIDIPVAVDLVATLKRGPIPAPAPVYGGYPPQQYPPQQPPQPAFPAGVNPNLANIIGGMNPAALQKVLGAIAQQPPPATSYGGYNQAPAMGQGPMLQGFGGQRQPQPTQQVQDIMAQLAALAKKP